MTIRRLFGVGVLGLMLAVALACGGDGPAQTTAAETEEAAEAADVSAGSMESAHETMTSAMESEEETMAEAMEGAEEGAAAAEGVAEDVEEVEEETQKAME